MWVQSLLASARNLKYLPHKNEILSLIRCKEAQNVERKILTASSFEESSNSLQKVLRNITKNDRRVFIKISNPPASLASQSIILPGHEDIHACAVVKDCTKLVKFPDSNTQTVNDVIFHGLSRSETGECLGTRSKRTGKYEWISYSEVNERMKNVGSGIIALGVPAGNESLIGIKTKNRTEFVLTMLGCSNYSMVLVPLYDGFGEESLSGILRECEMKIIICETVDSAKIILKQPEKYPHLKHIVVIDSTGQEISCLKHSDFNVLTFSEMEELGKANIQKSKPPTPMDLFSICYTSGTTGSPKGVMITHRNVMSCIGSLNTIFGEGLPKVGTLLSHLPCAHIYEIINEILTMYYGGRLGFCSGEASKIVEDMNALKPSVLTLVPKLMNVIYSGVQRSIMPNPIKRAIYHTALIMKERDLKRGIVSKNTIWDKLIFRQLQNFLGGNAELIITASAPISKEVMRFFRCATGCLVFEAYGQSEVCAATMTLMGEHECGFVGPPMPSNHVKLIDVPELDYHSKSGVGEICLRGPNVFSGYYKNTKATKEAIDSDGWHHTGDIGKWLPNGTLSIIDRKKHIFKLSQGEYIAPEKTENVYSQSHLFSHVFIDGDSDKDFVVAIVVPNKKSFIEWVEKNGFPEESFEKLCQKNDIRQAALKHLLTLGKKRDLNSLHQAGNVYLHPEPFSVENGLLTPTMKLKRPSARKYFNDMIKKLYEEGSMRKKCKMDIS